ncbi:alpha/beta hydrolase [Nocardia sp. NEAU-G5]|uniref:Alpha/beta hydrolase n=1 Tax=Nocardia albiluteola TaxID=2842303 RepID=A0ABS6BDT1_9NOCA|nr:alpha/beta hydrolase [Nocardia albiluteola]
MNGGGVEPTHRFVQTNGISMHIAEQGEGLPVIFCHGFPHGWFVWHRQLAVLAAAGYHAIAPDLRGYGRTEAPEGVEAHTNREVIADLLGLLDELGAERAVFVGLDFGAQLVWELALRAPERVEAVFVLNNPYAPRPPKAPSAFWTRAAERHFLHLSYFQTPGVADAELAARPREFLARVYYSLSGDYHYLDTWKNPPGLGYLDVLPQAPELPWKWLTEGEFEILATEFERTGFTGGLNWYRALDRNWELTAELPTVVEVPAYFLYGENDPDMEGFSGRDPLATLSANVRDLRAVEKVEGAGHLVHLERTGAVNEFLLTHLAELSPVGRR